MTTTRDLQPLDPNIQAELDRRGITLQVGDLVIEKEHSHNIYRIDSFSFSQYQQGQLVAELSYTFNGERHHYGSIVYTEFIEPRKRYYKLTDSYENLMTEAIASLSLPPQAEETSTETALTTSASTDRMKAMMRQKEAVADHAMVLKLMVERKIAEMQRQFEGVMRQVRYMGRVIELLETFIGVYQEVVTIREGAPAPVDTPITLRQLILYADEEVGTVELQSDGQMGIDFGNIEKLDEWILEDERHLNLLLPDLKGVVAIRPSRQERTYSDDLWVNADINARNGFVYLLVRNGERVSRIWANMKMGGKDRLFASSSEMERIAEELTRENLSEDHEIHLKNEELDWRQNAVLIEGLFERTDLFQPTPNRISLFDRACYERGQIVMVRDAEQDTLPDKAGRPRYKDWHKQLNAELKRGSRILLAPPEWRESKYGSDYFLNSSHSYQYPKPGVYVLDSVERRNERDVEVLNNWRNGEKLFDVSIHHSIKDIGTHTERTWDEYLTFLYLPEGSHVWVKDPICGSMMYKEREQRVRFFVSRNDWFVLNYDRISLKDVQYYIGNRLERRDYQQILPTLYQIRRERLVEREAEQPFANLIVNELGCTEAQVWDAIEWWKYRVIDHRAIASDDVKAWRMIRKRIQNPTYLDPKTKEPEHA